MDKDKTKVKNYHEEYDQAKSDKSWINQFKTKPRQSEKKILNYLVEKLTNLRKPKILDLGCGDGTFAKHLKAYIPDSEVHAWDPAKKLISNLKSAEKSDINWQVFNCFEGEDLVREHIEYFDCITVLATTQVLSGNTESDQKLAEIAKFFECVSRLLKREDSVFVNFDGYHDFPEYQLISHSWEIDKDFVSINLNSQPRLDACTYSYPSTNWLKTQLQFRNFKEIIIEEFFLEGIDIDYNNEPGTTFTKRVDINKTASMLGLIEQPWKIVYATR